MNEKELEEFMFRELLAKFTHREVTSAFIGVLKGVYKGDLERVEEVYNQIKLNIYESREGFK